MSRKDNNSSNNNNNNNDDGQSPSHDRRQALRQADAANALRVLDSYPLSKYFDIAQRLLDAFQIAVDNRQLDEAYVYGLRFANLSIQSLPQHREWRANDPSKAGARQKRKLAEQADRVLHMMETIKQRMDAEELKRLQEERRRREAEELAVQEQKDRQQAVVARQLQALEEQRRQAQEVEQGNAAKESHTANKRENTRKLSKTNGAASEKSIEEIEQSAMAKLLALQTPFFKKKNNSKAGTKASSPKKGTDAVKASEKKEHSTLQERQQEGQQLSQETKQKLANLGGHQASVQSITLKPTVVKQSSGKQTKSKTDSHSVAPNEQNSLMHDDRKSNTLVDTTRLPLASRPTTVRKHSSRKQAESKSDSHSVATKEQTSGTLDDDMISNTIVNIGKSNSDAAMSKSTKRTQQQKQKQHRQPLSSSSITKIDSSHRLKMEKKDDAPQVTSSTNPASLTNETFTKPTDISSTTLSSPVKVGMFASPEGTVETVDMATTKIPSSAITPSKMSMDVCSSISSSRSNITNSSPLTRKEQNTIDLLERTIRLQEQRLVQIETVQIPALLQQAKAQLRSGGNNAKGKSDGDKKKRALECVAKKRTLERQVDAIKAAIFNMETQMFMLENAMEDRHVQKALNEAAQVMQNIHQGVGIVVDADGINDTNGMDLLDLGTTVLPVMEEVDEDELMEELQSWMSPESDRKKAKGSKIEDDELASILSLPTVPASGLSVTVKGLRNAVTG